MRERPILFSTPMVQAILVGRKTVTRRVVTVPWARGRRALPYKPYWVDDDGALLFCDAYGDYRPAEQCLSGYGAPNDRLWVRETWAAFKADNRPNDLCVAYRASCGSAGEFDYAMADGSILGAKIERWTPSIHMPRWASRLTLEVVSVRVERLQEITEDDARKEGLDWVSPQPFGERWDDDREDPREVGYPDVGEVSGFARDNFRRLWDQINGKRAPWVSNPWVWRVEFRRVT